MKQFFPGPLSDHSRNTLRRLGYAEQRTRSGQISYTKRVGGERFPRYHVYVEDKDDGMQVNLHVDQKAASYEGTSAHGGEYEGPLCEREMARIASVVTTPATVAPQTNTPTKKKGFLSKFF